MKKSDKETAKILKAKLEAFDAANPLPSELSKDNITEALKQQPAPAPKQAKILQMKHIVSAAAAIVIIFGAVTVYNLFVGSPGNKVPVDNAEANTSLQTSGNSVQNSNNATGNETQTTTSSSSSGNTAATDANGTTNGTNKPHTTKAPVITDVNNYKEIIKIFKTLSDEAAEQRDSNYYYGVSGDKSEGFTVPAATANDSATEETGSQDSKFGETNVQIKGIDEPDVMKNDGKYLYTVNSGNEINIFSLLPADNMKLVSTIKFVEKEGKTEYANSLFVKGNLLVVFSNTYTYRVFEETPAKQGETATGDKPAESIEPAVDYYYPGYFGNNESVCTVYDISNRTAPKEVKKISQDGDFISARLISNELYVLSSYYVNIYYKDYLEDICIPSVTIDGTTKTIPAADINVTKDPEPSYLVVCGINLNDLDSNPDTAAVLGGGSQAYCTKDSLFVSRTVWAPGVQTNGLGLDIAVADSSSTYSTEIYRFAIGGGKVTFKNSGKVAGQILNQFSMDEYDGYFRIATTQGDWGKTSSNVFVLNEKLETVGKVENIAPKEQIFAVRFMGSTGYVVTFEQKDPLFVLDLSNPTAPKITGELKIPGFSSYLHPVSDTLLLGIGQNGNDDGTTPGIKLSLFDVSDPAKPKEVDKYIIEGDSYSEAMNNHKAFMTYPEKDLFGLPVTTYNYQVYDEGGTSGNSSSSSVSFDGMVSSFNTYTVKGGKIVAVRNYLENNSGSESEGYYYGGISRGTYVDDTLFTLSGAALTSYSMDTGKVLDTLKITQPIYNYYDYGVKEPMVVG